MASEPALIIQVPRGGTVERALGVDPPQAVADGEVVVTTGPADADGRLEPPQTGDVVLSVPSPEALQREPDEVRRVIQRAGTGAEPLVVEVEGAEELRDEEIAAVVAAAEHTSRAVILRILRDV
jgi:hypothetical protein